MENEKDKYADLMISIRKIGRSKYRIRFIGK